MVLFQILTPDFAVVTSRMECGRMDQRCSRAMNKRLCNIPLQKKVFYGYAFCLFVHFQRSYRRTLEYRFSRRVFHKSPEAIRL